MSKSKANLFFFLCALSSTCVVYWNSARFVTRGAGPLHKSASRSTLRVDMKSLEDSMDCATKFAGWHLQDVSCIGADNIVIGPVVVIVEGMPLVSSCHVKFKGCTHGDILYVRF